MVGWRQSEQRTCWEEGVSRLLLSVVTGEEEEEEEEGEEEEEEMASERGTWWAMMSDQVTSGVERKKKRRERIISTLLMMAMMVVVVCKVELKVNYTRLLTRAWTHGAVDFLVCPVELLDGVVDLGGAQGLGLFLVSIFFFFFSSNFFFFFGGGHIAGLLRLWLCSVSHDLSVANGVLEGCAYVALLDARGLRIG